MPLSAVLPTIPSSLDREYVKRLIISLYKEDSEIRDIIHEVVDEIIVKEHEITKRLAGVEQVTGVANHELEGEEHKVTFEERFGALENQTACGHPNLKDGVC
jgi:hypothetical protein